MRVKNVDEIRNQLLKNKCPHECHITAQTKSVKAKGKIFIESSDKYGWGNGMLSGLSKLKADIKKNLTNEKFSQLSEQINCDLYDKIPASAPMYIHKSPHLQNSGLFCDCVTLDFSAAYPNAYKSVGLVSDNVWRYLYGKYKKENVRKLFGATASQKRVKIYNADGELSDEYTKVDEVLRDLWKLVVRKVELDIVSIAFILEKHFLFSYVDSVNFYDSSLLKYAFIYCCRNNIPFDVDFSSIWVHKKGDKHHITKTDPISKNSTMNRKTISIKKRYVIADRKSLYLKDSYMR